MKSNAKRICSIVAIVFIVFFAGSTFLQIQNNKTNADRSCSLILDQLEDVIDENEESINTLMETLKEEYLVRAKMISYMVEDHGESQLTAEEYQKLAEYASVDEIHLFDKNGTIVAGSNPEYYGYNFDSGEQMGYFKPMLRDKSKEMCQNVTENTAEKKPMMYAIVWASCEKHMVQIGISPSRLLKEMENSDISSLIDKIPVTEGMDIFLVDTASGKIVSSTNKKYVGKTGNSDLVERHPVKTKERYFDQVEIGGEKYYVGYEKLDGYIVAISYARNVANKDLPITMIILGITLLLAFALLSYIVTASFRKIEESLEKAEKANQAKLQFLSRMSHDIRTPLNGIIGLLEIGEKHAGERELIDANRQKAKVAANHLLALLSDVLELSKMDDENVTLAHEPFDVRELADEILTITELRASEQGITVIHSDCSVNAVCPYVYGSPLHVKRVILNIFSNAIKYNKPKGSITCSMDMLPVDEKTVAYKVTISDTGIGMSPEFLEHMFEPFSQERNDARSTYQGTGLGMAIVKSLLDKMNGTITVESKVGEGSTFTVTIPLEIASKEELSEQNTDDVVNLSGNKVLLVEDNELNMEIATVLLEDAGLEVTKAQNGMEAVQIFSASEEGTFHLILTDLMMPEMDGFETAKTIRAMEREDAKTIPIIAMTANVFDEDVQKCMDVGMNGHLMKPLDVEKLMNTLASVLKL